MNEFRSFFILLKRGLFLILFILYRVKFFEIKIRVRFFKIKIIIKYNIYKMKIN